MEFKLIKREKIIIANNLSKYYKYILDTRKIVLVLANQQELLDLHNVTKYFRRKFIKNVDPNNIKNKTIKENDVYFIKKHYIPLVNGFKISYYGNYSLNIIELFKFFPSNKEVGVYRITNPGYVKETSQNINILYLNSNLEYLLKTFKNNNIISFVDYFDMNTNIKFNKIESNYNYKEIKHIDFNTDKREVIIHNMYQSYTINYDLIDELLSIPKRLEIITNCLNLLKKNGDFYLVFIHVITETSLQIFSEISKLFESYQYIESSFQFSSNGMIIFKKYIGRHDFDNILNKYKTLDESMGQKFVNNHDNIILFNLNTTINNEFLSFYKDIIENKILKYEQLITKIKYINQRKNNPKFIRKIIDDQIDYALKYCKNNKLSINKFYKNFYFLLKKEDYLKRVFPIANINYSKLQIDYESTYSITHPNDANEITKLIKDRYPKLKIIADMTANVGGNTINFCRNFEFVYSIEIDKNTFSMLKNNVNIYNLKNCELINKNSNDFINKKVELYFYDPPWTGIFYKTNVNMSLYLSSINIKNILKSHFCIKVPTNYNIPELLEKFPNLEIIKLKYFIIIFNKLY